MEEQQPPIKKKRSASTIIVSFLAVIIIIALAGLFYYYSIKPAPAVPEELRSVVNKKPAQKIPQIIPTDVITFSPPATLPMVQKSGKCWVSSIAAPFRKDAWRCMVVNSIYDPCFETPQKGLIYCQMNPLEPDSVLIKITQTLPKPDVPPTIQENWAWFLTLKDGTFCSPFTGTRPFFGTGPDAKVAYYGCKSDNKDQQIVLLGDLKEDVVWTAEEAVLTKTGTNWTIKSTQQVDIDTVWQ